MLPKWLYEALPYIYIVVAIIVLASLQITVGLLEPASLVLLIAGLLLGMAGVAILAMRDAYRRNKGS